MLSFYEALLQMIIYLYTNISIRFREMIVQIKDLYLHNNIILPTFGIRFIEYTLRFEVECSIKDKKFMHYNLRSSIINMCYSDMPLYSHIMYYTFTHMYTYMHIQAYMHTH